MLRSALKALVEPLGWVVFPLVPTVLACWFYGVLSAGQQDPRNWDRNQFMILLGPLVGYGFLAGATLVVADVPCRRGGWVGRLMSRRALWVAVGPWVGFLVTVAIYLLVSQFSSLLGPDAPELFSPATASAILMCLVCFSSYGWLLVAFAALVRARRARRLGRALVCGLTMAVGFVGSLLAAFWTATEVWRSYFFDSRLARMVIIGLLSVAVLTGCSATVTVGDVRRREFFSALMMAWVLGLGLAWRWWARSRRGEPRS